ncbi:Uncharacterized protein PCOAH_00015520 [Plasmodium coatneyi]|uniref:Uncharacterized protein n=1 Tax=Plasmodium coatneyi TaxID=208452 RepID=A0A1B1DXK2_9APIC|nr:Uncharacterized protein PCOAH_00015520 [Plasmodium coatneyi]ANQ07359.1 Uncharacterized protein PCOAH_00015520 [Plasmodium coatneyi]
MREGVLWVSIGAPKVKVTQVPTNAEGKKHTGNHVNQEDNAKWEKTNALSLKGWGNVCVRVFLLLCLFVKVHPHDMKHRRMLCIVNHPWWKDFIISTKELEEGVQKLTHEVGYNDISEEDGEAIVSTELINRNIAAFLRINKKAIRKWYKQCLSAKIRYWQVKMNFWRRFKMYTWLELFLGEKTRGVDEIWKNKMWIIWFTYIHRIMWIEDVADTSQFKRRIKKCYSYIYIRDRYAKKKRHFREVKQKKIENAWNNFLDSYVDKWEKEKKTMAMSKCTARKKQPVWKQPMRTQPVRNRAKVVFASSFIPPGPQRLEDHDDCRIGSRSNNDGRIGGSIGSSQFLNRLNGNTKTRWKESLPIKSGAGTTGSTKSMPTKTGVAKKGIDKNGTAKTGVDGTTATPKQRKVNERKFPPSPPSAMRCGKWTNLPSLQLYLSGTDVKHL